MNTDHILTIHDVLKRAEREILVKTGHSMELSMKEVETDLSVVGIVNRVGEILEVPAWQIMGNSRVAKIVDARFIAIHLVKTRLDLSVTEIAKVFNKDHSTIAYAIKKTSMFLSAEDERLMPKLQTVLNTLP